MTLREYFGNSKILLSLIGINVAVAALIKIGALLGLSHSPDLSGRLLSLPASAATFLSRPWTLFTYMFTQMSLLHLLFNMLWLLWFGKIFLLCASGKRLLWGYIGGGLAGAFLFLAVCNIGGTAAGSFLIGSSASVLAVMTAAALMAPNLELNLLLLGRVRLKYVALLCIVLTFIGIGGGNAGGLAAHLGGIIWGFIIPSLSSVSQFRKVFNAKPSHRSISPIDDETRLDELLEKVRLSGYDSLSSSEKAELNSISKRL